MVVSSNNHGSIDMEGHRVNLTVQKVTMVLRRKVKALEQEPSVSTVLLHVRIQILIRPNKYEQAMYIARHARVEMHQSSHCLLY